MMVAPSPQAFRHAGATPSCSYKIKVASTLLQAHVAAMKAVWGIASAPSVKYAGKELDEIANRHFDEAAALAERLQSTIGDGSPARIERRNALLMWASSFDAETADVLELLKAEQEQLARQPVGGVE